MKYLNECEIGGEIKKTYALKEKRNAYEILQSLKEKNVDVLQIGILEDADLGLKAYGEKYYDKNSFDSEEIIQILKDTFPMSDEGLTFNIVYQNIQANLNIYKNIISVYSANKDINLLDFYEETKNNEIDDMLEEKK